MEPQVIGKADSDSEELTKLADAGQPWPHILPADELEPALVQAAFGSLAADAETERQRVAQLEGRAGDTLAKRNRREVYLSAQQRRRWEAKARHFLERRPDVVKTLSTEALYSALIVQHLLELDAADPGLPASERLSEDAFKEGLNGQFLLDATRGRYVVEGEAFHFKDVQAEMTEEAFIESLSEAVRRVVLRRGDVRLLERVTTAMSQSGIAAVERASLCRTAVSGGSVQVDYRLDEDPEHEDGLLLRLHTCRQGFRKYLPGSGDGEDATPLPCDAGSFLLKRATVAYGPGGAVDILDFGEDVNVRRGGEKLDPELFCVAIPWLDSGKSPASLGAPRRRCSLMDCARQLCGLCRPRRWSGWQAAAAGRDGASSNGGATLEL